MTYKQKGILENTWKELYTFDEDENIMPVAPNNTEYTIVSIPKNNYPANGTIDFQVRAVNATVHAEYPGIQSPFGYWTYQASGWSNIETINLADGSVSTTPYTNPTPLPIPTAAPIITPTETQTPTPTATVPELSWLALIPLFASMLAVAWVIRHQKFKSRNFD
jgi:hypothetical protein